MREAAAQGKRVHASEVFSCSPCKLPSGKIPSRNRLDSGRSLQQRQGPQKAAAQSEAMRARRLVRNDQKIAPILDTKERFATIVWRRERFLGRCEKATSSRDGHAKPRISSETARAAEQRGEQGCSPSGKEGKDASSHRHGAGPGLPEPYRPL
jgi:hypothetical protein